LTLNGQDKCECCTYYSIENEELYGYFFNPGFLKTNQFTIATIYTTETNSQKSFKFIHAKFLFDSLGNITARYDYNQNGKPHMIKEFIRDYSGKIVKTSHAYLRDDESKSDFWEPTIVDFDHNQSGQILKIKERDYSGNILADSLSNYTKYSYDVKGRLINEYRFANFSNQNSAYNMTLRYTSPYESIGITKNNGKDWLKTVSKFDNKNRLLSQIDYNYPDSKMVWGIFYKYDDDKLINQIRKDGIGVTECPDNNEFTEEYLYNNIGLLEKVIHKFNSVTCEMIIKYE